MTSDTLRLLPLAAIPLPPGYEAVWKSANGHFTTPIVAATFQNNNFEWEDNVYETLDERGSLSIVAKLWEMTAVDGLTEVDVVHQQFVGVKTPGQTMEEFLKESEEWGK